MGNITKSIKNPYLVSGIIILAVILVFVFTGKKTEAPAPSLDNDEQIEVETNLPDGTYNIDTASSKITWKGEFVGGISETGTIGFSSGSINVEGGEIKSGSFVIDINTIADNEGKQMLVDHLKSKDFFDVATYPSATFELRSFAPTSSEGALIGRYVVGGNLTVRGITLPTSFIATILPIESGISAKASFAINRADWEIKYNSSSFFQNLGDKAIRDAVEIKLDLQAVKRP